MQEVFEFSIYFTCISVSGPMYAQEISASRFVELCLGVVLSETSSYFTHIHTHTHTHIILSQHFSNNFSLHTTLYSDGHRHEPRTTYVC
jgi:hypothetical protein